jgi:hypothetical protein
VTTLQMGFILFFYVLDDAIHTACNSSALILYSIFNN